MFRAVRTDVYFLVLPSKYDFVVWTGTVLPFIFFRLEGLKQPVPVVARSKTTFRFLELRVRIRPGAWMAVSCEYYVLSGSGLCGGRPFVQRSSTERGGSEHDQMQQ